MRILAVETSGTVGGIAVLDEDCVLAERELPSEGRRHAQSLVKQTDEVLRSLPEASAAVDVVAVSIGPGSFTGLRVGVVFAKTWCYATGAKLVAVDTLQAAAEQGPADAGRITAIADAQRGDVYAGEYEKTAAGLSRLQPIAIVNAGEFAMARSEKDVITGPALERHQALFEGRGRLVDAADRTPRAATIGRIGQRLALAGEFVDLWSIEPFYLRKSAAEEKREAEGRGGIHGAPSS